MKTSWNQNGVQSYEGVYQSITEDNGYKYRIAFIKGNEEKYFAIYLSGLGHVRSWKEGDVIGVFDSAAYQGVFLGDWVMIAD